MNHPQVSGTPGHGVHVDVVRLDLGWEGIVYDQGSDRIVYTWPDQSEERAWQMCGDFLACWKGKCNP